MKKSIILSASLFFLIALSGRSASAQTIYGVSAIQEVGGTVQLYTATALDAAAYEVYDAAIAGSIYLDNFQNIVAEGGNSGGWLSEILVTAPAFDDRDYFGIGDHYIVAYYFVPTLGLWYDPYGFSLFSGEYPGEISFFGCACPTYIPEFVYLFSTVVGIPTQCRRTPTLSGASTITRNQSVNYTIGNLCRAFTISNWKFTDNSSNPPVIRTDSPGATNWSGALVTSGTVSVTVQQGGAQHNLSKSTSITARTGFSVAAAQPVEDLTVTQQSPTFSCAGSPTIFPVPPSGTTESGRLFGEYCIDQPYEFDFDLLNGGPNKGYRVVTKVTNKATFRYALNPTLKSASSVFTAFSQAQTGSYNAQTNPNGCILFATLLSNTINHEAGLTQNSHWVNYRQAQDNASDNIGVAGEPIVGEPALTEEQWKARVRGILDPKTGPIKTATRVEPCGASEVTKDSTCTFRGKINYPPYPPCP